MSEEQPGQVWEVGQSVIIFQPYGRYGQNDHAVQVVKIESVAPKSFVAGKQRWRKDKLTVSRGGGFADTKYQLVRMDDPRSDYLLAERFVQRQAAKVAEAEKHWGREHTVEHAADLQVELYAWVEAENARKAAADALRERFPSGSLLEIRADER